MGFNSAFKGLNTYFLYHFSKSRSPKRHPFTVFLCYFYFRYSCCIVSLPSFYCHGLCIHYNMWQCFNHIILFKIFLWISELYFITEYVLGETFLLLPTLYTNFLFIYQVGNNKKVILWCTANQISRCSKW